MHIFDGNLKAIETTYFRNSNILHEIYDQVFIYDTIAGSKETQHMFYEMTFIVV